MIRYPDGAVRNLTREAGFGEAEEMQGRSAHRGPRALRHSVTTSAGRSTLLDAWKSAQ
jgi:hypothetical protein